jgi:hypothetical protein
MKIDPENFFPCYSLSYLIAALGVRLIRANKNVSLDPVEIELRDFGLEGICRVSKPKRKFLKGTKRFLSAKENLSSEARIT